MGGVLGGRHRRFVAYRGDPVSGQIGNQDLDWLADLAAQYLSGLAAQTGQTPHINDLPGYFADLRRVFDTHEDGGMLVLLDGLRICRENKLPPPEWLEAGLRRMVIDFALGRAAGKKGRGNTPLAKELLRMKKAKRAEVFRRIRYMQQLEPEPILEAIMLPTETQHVMLAGKLKSLGTTREEALRATEISLRGTFAQASFATLDREMSEYQLEDENRLSPELSEELGLPIFEDFNAPRLHGISLMSLDDFPDPRGQGD